MSFFDTVAQPYLLLPVTILVSAREPPRSGHQRHPFPGARNAVSGPHRQPAQRVRSLDSHDLG